MGESKKLKAEVREDIRAEAIRQYKDLANKECEGELLAMWVLGLLENCHLYDWYEG